MNTTVMAGEVTTPKKVAFVDRKSANSERIEQDEKELKELLEEKENVNKENTEEVEVQEAEPVNAEEKSFKKRYGDLRRHQQTKEKEYENRIKALEEQLAESTKSEIKLPKSDEDIEAWAKQYPDVAGIVETIAIKKAREEAQGLEDAKKEIKEMKTATAREKAEVELMRAHPDFGEIRDSDDFHNWAEEQPKWVQEALYENDTDARSASRAIDLYKADMNITTKKPVSTKDAARSVDSRSSRDEPKVDGKEGTFTESQVAKMTPQQYEKASDQIMEAIRTGKFIYDMSGSAR
jgi:DNA repair exonuclease SbcCD ATPase subunit